MSETRLNLRLSKAQATKIRELAKASSTSVSEFVFNQCIQDCLGTSSLKSYLSQVVSQRQILVELNSHMDDSKVGRALDINESIYMTLLDELVRRGNA